MTAPLRRFNVEDHHCAWILDYNTSWFDHFADRFRTVLPSFDPALAEVLLKRLEALDVGYVFAHEPSKFYYRNPEEELSAVAALNAIFDYTVSAFGAAHTVLADDLNYRDFWLVSGVANPYPYRDVLIATEANEPVCFVDLHDRDDLGLRELHALATLPRIVVLDLAATNLTNSRLSEISFGALPALRALDLSENPFGELPAELIAPRSPSALESLDLRKTRVSAESVAELRRARPTLNVRY